MEDDVYCYVVVDDRVIGDTADFQTVVFAMIVSYYAISIQYTEVAADRLELIERQVQAICP